MRKLDISISELEEFTFDKQIILFGAGELLRGVASIFFSSSKIPSRVKYIVDNMRVGEKINWCGKEHIIREPNCILGEKNCTIIIVNKNNLSDIVAQIDSMNLDDSISLVYFYFIVAKSCGKDSLLLNEMGEVEVNEMKSFPRIPKKIHTFWFSGEELPKEYRYCIDSWNKYCPEYDVIVWDLNSYYSQNTFFCKAIDSRKWAFAADYARLDVLFREGGVYMDADIEVIRNIDYFLKYNAFFSFDAYNCIGLEIFGTISQNELIGELLSFYNKQDFFVNDLVRQTQPLFISNVIKDYGVNLDGNTQYMNNMLFASRNVFNPEDGMLYETYVMNDNTYTIHHSCSAWQDKEEKRMATLNARKIKNEFIDWA